MQSSSTQRTCVTGRRGLTLVEVLVGIAIFLIISLGIYEGYAGIMRLVGASKIRTLAMLAANEEIELIRNFPYGDVGIEQGIPLGIIPREQTVVKGGVSFLLRTTVRNIDDPFDGTIGGSPNDLSPADYKQVAIDVGCPACKNFSTTTVTTTIAPKNLESTGSNGALFIIVFDANGVGIPGASVHIENPSASPAIVINELTNNDGMLQLVDVPPGTFAYQITVTKAGYSTARTYPVDDPDNPNPSQVHATVATGALTEMSFAIDQVSTLLVETVRENCEAVPDSSFTLHGAKTVGTDPTIYKYDQSHVTGSDGRTTINSLEWDTYTPALTESSLDFAGSLPLSPFALNPGAELTLRLVIATKDSNTLLVTVKDVAGGLPLSDATVTLSRTGFSESKVTNRGHLTQTDWSGGGGQVLYSDETKYYNANSIDNGGGGGVPAGELALATVLEQYASAGNLESSVMDTGGASTTYYTLLWEPGNQATSTGAESIRFQIATGNDPATTTWNYRGPDGSSGSYYSISNGSISATHSNERYLRYTLLLQTADTSVSPSLSNLSVTYGSLCTPYGQALFQGLELGTYTVTVERAGYQTYANDSVSVGGAWQGLDVSLSP